MRYFDRIATALYGLLLVSRRLPSTMVWLRPNGPPKVWDTVEIVNPDGEILKFIIQDIPEDRYDEVIEHMCSIFIRDEILCGSLNVINDVESVRIFRDYCTKNIAEGMTIAAFHESGSDKPVIAAVNVLSVCDKESNIELRPLLSTMSNAEKIVNFSYNCNVEGNPCGKYGVDLYLGAHGLSVDPSYRRLGLGKRLLATRLKVGKIYGISVTSTFFSSTASQATAVSAGFQVHSERIYDEIVDENGDLVFPKLKGKGYKVMGKKFF